jgi:hypothetical protein
MDYSHGIKDRQQLIALSAINITVSYKAMFQALQTGLGSCRDQSTKLGEGGRSGPQAAAYEASMISSMDRSTGANLSCP